MDEDKAKSSIGKYVIPAGYIYETEDGKFLLKNVMLREIMGEEEDIFGQDDMSFAERFQIILGRCLLELSDDDGHIISADTDEGKRTLLSVPGDLLLSDLSVLLIRLRQITVGNEISFTTNCQNPQCRSVLSRFIKLDTLEVLEMDGDPLEREREFETSRGTLIKWKMMTGSMQIKAERAAENLEKEAQKSGRRKTTLAKALKAKKDRKATAFMLERVIEVNGKEATYQSLNLPWAEREDIREHFDEEGGLDTEVEVRCDCGHIFLTELRIAGDNFFSRSER